MNAPKLLIISVTSCICVSCGGIDPDAQISFPSANKVHPLDSAGIHVTRIHNEANGGTLATSDGTFQVGDYVEVAQNGVPLFATYPRSGTRVKKALDAGVVLNVLGINGKYMHVQSEGGDEGYVSNGHVVPQGLLNANVPLGEADVAVQ